MTRSSMTRLQDRDPPVVSNRRQRSAPRTAETIEDRLGAQGAYDAGYETEGPLTEIARLLARMLSDPSGLGSGLDRSVIASRDAAVDPAPDPVDEGAAEQPEQPRDAETEAAETVASPMAEAAAETLEAVPEARSEELQAPDLPQNPEGPEAEAETGNIPEVAPARAAPLSAPPAPDAAAAAGGGGSHRAVVRRWQAGVRTAGGGLPETTVTLVPAVREGVRSAARGGAARSRAAREGVTEEAVNTVPETPEVEDAPPPPPSNPIPDHTARVTRLSGRRLDDETVPALVPSLERTVEGHVIGGDLPRLNERPVAADVFNVLTSPDARALAESLVGEASGEADRDSQARRMAEALEQLEPSEEAADGEREGQGEQTISPDRGARPMPPLPEALQAPVGQVVARLLAQSEQTTEGVLDRLRETAFRGGVLKENFPEIGSEMQSDLSGMVTADLREIAEAANVSSDELDTMVTDRLAELERSSAEAETEAATEAEAAEEELTGETQATADAIAGAADAAEEETLRRQEAAGGAADPTVINARRDRTITWVRNQVTTQITNYQQAGDRRVGELNAAKRKQIDGYRALSQREQYQVLTPGQSSEAGQDRAPRDTADTARERRLADVVQAIRTWTDQRVRTLSEAFRTKTSAATTATATNRNAIETAGSNAIEAARVWAEDTIHANDSWWDRMMRRISRWLTEAGDVTEEWRVRRTQAHRDATATDVQLLQAAQAQVNSGLTQEQVLANDRLTEAQRAVLREYFDQPEGRHPLEFAAQRLKNNIATSHLARAKSIFERELIAMPVSDGEIGKAMKIVAIARTEGAFNAEQIVTSVHAAMDQWGTDEDKIYENLRGLNALKGAAVRKLYYAHYGRSLDADLRDELSGGELERANMQLQGRTAEAEAVALNNAIAGWGTDEAAIMSLLRNKSPAEIDAIRTAYEERFGESLQDALEGDLSEGNEIDQANALIAGDNELADAIALDEAMRGGFLGMGTSEEDVEGVYAQMRREVLQRAQAENWTSEQLEAEMRRRLGRVEEHFEDRYSEVEQYNAPGLAGDTVLERAYHSEMSMGERDLALALQNNDMIAADAARIEIERTSFYASDEALNNVLRSQYERALEARRLDEGPARNMAVRQAVTDARAQGLSEEEVSRIRMRTERQMERELADGAQQDSRMSMAQLEETYQSNYTWPMDFVLEWGMSGDERNKARNMLEQGGRLTPLQELEYATRGVGTDEDTLRRLFSTMTSAEIAELRTQWEARNPGRDMYSMLASETSGRDRSDILDMAAHGAPESAMEQIDQERRRVRRERDDLTGVLGRSISEREERWMEYHLRELESLEPDLQRTDWPDTPEATRERDRLQGEVTRRTAVVQDAVEDHRRRLDSFTDAATQAVGIVVGLTVAVVLGALSGGTLGVATIALMASVMATASTMATKALILGGAYGEEAILTDLAVGAVDAVVSVATAGLGNKMLGPMLQAARRLRVGDAARFIGRSGAMRGLSRAVGQGTLGRAARRALPSPATVERAAAGFMAESIEDAVSAAPSAFVQIALTDETWKGDPFANFLQNGGMALLQSIAMGRAMGGATSLGGGAFRSLRGRLRQGSDVGRLLEANRLIQEGYARFQMENPNASLTDFLAHPAGRRVRSDIEARGLMPDIEAAGRAAADPAGPTARTDNGAGPTRQADAEIARTAELETALPPSLREGTLITPDADLHGRTVSVEPVWVGNRVIAVDVRVGPDATPMDVALHAATVHAMQRYRGVLGNVRRVLENMAATITRSGLHVGSRGWEARLEVAKLSAIISDRMGALSGPPLTPEVQARITAEVEGLQAQLEHNQRVFADPELRDAPGRGRVAAEDESGLTNPASGVFDEIPTGNFVALPPEVAATLNFSNSPRLDAGGDITASGMFDLEYRLGAAEAHLALGTAAGLADAQTILHGVSTDYGIPMHTLHDGLARVAAGDGVGHILEAAGMRPHQDAPSTPSTTATTAPPHSTPTIDGIADFRQRGADLADPNALQRAPTASELHTRLANGNDPAAQAALRNMSAAPDGHIEVIHNDQSLAALFDPATNPDARLDNGPPAFMSSLIRVGEGVIPVARVVDGQGNPTGPITFHGEFPPLSQTEGHVLQLFDGRLRVWRDPETGALRQESLVGPRVDRAGHEQRALETHTEAGLEGPATQRAHAHGAGRGVESPFGILHAPVEVNQWLQRLGIEAYLSRLQRAGGPGIEFHYVTSVTPQADGVRLGRIEYEIEVTVNGHRMPLATFAINVDPLPPGIPPNQVVAQNIVHVEPVTFLDPIAMVSRARSATGDPIPSAQRNQYEALFDGIEELVNVPNYMRYGLPRVPPEMGDIMTDLIDAAPETVNATVDRHSRLAAHPPAPAASFDVEVWAAGLRSTLDGDPQPRFVVVDTRGTDLTPDQLQAMADIISNLPAGDYDRLYPIADQ